jgi:hypothetical protein
MTLVAVALNRELSFGVAPWKQSDIAIEWHPGRHYSRWGKSIDGDRLHDKE